jgi:hypothetical protein
MKHHAIKIYGKVEVQLHAFLTSVLDDGEWLALPRWKTARYPFYKMMGGL